MMKKAIKKQIEQIVNAWLEKQGAGIAPLFSLDVPPKTFNCDLATNVAMLLAKQLKTNPRNVATELKNLIETSMIDKIRSVEIAGAGFLNITLADEFIKEKLEKIYREDFVSENEPNSEKILLEFVSANPTGPLHIGHGRGAAIGDSLGRIFRFAGYNIEKEYYMNDVGNQMEMLGLSVKTRYLELKGEKIEFPENGYKGDYIKDISKKVIDLPADKINFKKLALKEISSTIESGLKKFDVTFDNWFSEGTLAVSKDGGKTKVDEACEFLKQKGFAYEKEGALWFETTKFGDEKDRVLKRSDGRYTYLASDVAYHKNKIERGYTKLIDIWGADHHGYVARMKAAVETLGMNKDNLVVILYQLVSLVRDGKPVAMSTRSGEFVTLEEVLNEVGKDACRFFFLLRAPDSHLEFDLELAKKQSKENPVFYVQYVHARCCSLFKEAALKQNIKKEELTYDFECLTAPEERELIKKLLLFTDITDLCVKTLTPHHLTTYLMETADAFHHFYEACRVVTVDQKLTMTRLALVKSVANVIKNGLNLLGVSAPERM
jgi:arginyl-tRNA synthetase